MDIKVGDRVRLVDGAIAVGEVVAILNPDASFPVVVEWADLRYDTHFTEDELEVIS